MSRILVFLLLAGCTSDPVVVNVVVSLPDDRQAPDLSVGQVGHPGITVSPSHGLFTSASGASAVFSVVLDSRPKDMVTVTLASSDLTQGTVSPSKLTFTADNWDLAQKVTVIGFDDQIVSGNHVYQILLARAVSGDDDYNGLDPTDVSVTNMETDVPGIVVEAASGLTTKFGVSTATFSMRLKSQPESDVTVGLTSSDTQQGNVSPSSLTFTPDNWKTSQPVAITAVDDLIAGGNRVYSILTGVATSTDPHYAGINPDDVNITNLDVNTAGITVSPIAGLTTTENGGTAQFNVKLTSMPTANVTIGLTSSATSHGTVSPATLTFTTGVAGNWGTNHPVTVTGKDDLAVTGNVDYTIITAAAVSADSVYNGRNASDVTVTSIDGSVAGITVSPTSGLVTHEGGGTDTFTIVLNTVPSANVTINLSSDNSFVGAVSPTSVTFTSANWNNPRTITAQGIGDSLAGANKNTAVDGNKTWHVVTAAASSSDGNYSGINPPNVTVTDQDDDVLVYGSNASDAASMVWCLASNGVCSTALNVNIPRRGGTANFAIQITGAVHGVESTASTSEAPASPQLTFTPVPWEPTGASFGAGSHPFDCWVHGATMTGSINVP